jgi:hypothetical protein
MKTLAPGISLVIATLLAGAAQAMPPTSLEKAELSMMSVARQKEVLARIGGSSTVDEVIEAMLLDQLSDEFAQGTVVGVDFDDGVVIVRSKKGQLKAYAFEPLTMTLKPPPAPAK